ncbi:MAG: oxidoreductase, partial [Azoarcus sp.]
MDCFNNRRDRSAAGLKQRERFGQLIESLVERGLAHNKARTELLKVMRGEHSTI